MTMVNGTEQREWISTGEAAKILGYRSVAGFRQKFFGVITLQRHDGGHIRWCAAEVWKLKEIGTVRPKAPVATEG